VADHADDYSGVERGIQLAELRWHWGDGAPRGALLYCPLSGRELEEVFLGLMTYS